MRQLLVLVIMIGFLPNAFAKGQRTKLKHRVSCACEYTNIDGRIDSGKRVYGVGAKKTAKNTARKNCQSLAPVKSYKAILSSCVYDRVKVDKAGNIISMKRVMEEEDMLASDLDALL